MVSKRFYSSDNRTLTKYYKSCAVVALSKGDTKGHKKYIRLIEEMEASKKK